MYTYLQQVLPRVFIHRTQVVEKKWKLWVRFSPKKENPVHQTKISTKTDKDSFSLTVFSSVPVTEYLVYCVCVLFSLAKSMLGMGSGVRFFCHNILFLRTMWGEGSSVSAVEFRCCEISLVNQKLTFKERIICITRHDDFSTRSHREVSLQVAPFLRDCKGKSYRRGCRAGQTERETSEFIVIWFKFISNRDFNREKIL